MARYKRLNVLSTMVDIGLIPLFYEGNEEVAEKIIWACLDGGARCIEFTNRGDQALHVFEKLNCAFRDDPRLILGVGTVVDAVTAGLYIQLGANFIVGPMFDEETALLCNRRKIAYIPGCGSVNEISQAEKFGVEIVKVFPGTQIGGPSFIRMVLGPMPWTSMMPTGGVKPEESNIQEWIKAGAVCVGIGSQLISKEAVENNNFREITNKVKQTLNWITEARK